MMGCRFTLTNIGPANKVRLHARTPFQSTYPETYRRQLLRGGLSLRGADTASSDLIGVRRDLLWLKSSLILTPPHIRPALSVSQGGFGTSAGSRGRLSWTLPFLPFFGTQLGLSPYGDVRGEERPHKAEIISGVLQVNGLDRITPRVGGDTSWAHPGPASGPKVICFHYDSACTPIAFAKTAKRGAVRNSVPIRRPSPRPPGQLEVSEVLPGDTADSARARTRDI